LKNALLSAQDVQTVVQLAILLNGALLRTIFLLGWTTGRAFVGPTDHGDVSHHSNFLLKKDEDLTNILDF